MRRFSIGLVAGFLSLAALLSLAHAQMPVVPEAQTAQGVFEPYGPSGLPINAVQVFVNATGTTAATTASMPAVAGKTNYLCGFNIDTTAASAAFVGPGLTGLLGGTLSIFMGVTVSPVVSSYVKTFTPCLPASAVNTAITLTTGAAGTSGFTAATVWGYVR